MGHTQVGSAVPDLGPDEECAGGGARIVLKARQMLPADRIMPRYGLLPLPVRGREPGLVHPPPLGHRPRFNGL